MNSSFPRAWSTLAACVLVGLSFCDARASAQRVRVELASGEHYGLPEAARSWEPPSGSLDDWDWMLLTSGEWVKGTLKSARDDQLVFASDKLGDLTLSFADVAALYADKPKVFMTADRRQLVGKARMRGDTLWIDETPIEKGEVLALLEGPPREAHYWKVKANLSLALREGNSKQVTLTDYLFVRREDVLSRMTIESNGTYGLTDDVVTIQTQTGLAQFDLFVSRRFYISPVLVNATHDRFQNLTLRLVPGVSAGMHALDVDGLTWDLELGPGYQYIRYITVEPGERQTRQSPVLRVATRLSADLADPLHLDVSWTSTLIPPPAFGLTSHHGQAMLSLNVVEHLDSTIAVVFDRVEDPPQNDDGTKPVSNDIQITFGILVDI